MDDVAEPFGLDFMQVTRPEPLRLKLLATTMIGLPM
jgi:hypothetical protein